MLEADIIISFCKKHSLFFFCSDIEDVLSSLEEAPVNSTPSNLLADTNVATETLSGAHGGSPSPVHEPSSDAGDLNCDAISQVQSSLLHSCSGWSHTIFPAPTQSITVCRVF